MTRRKLNETESDLLEAILSRSKFGQDDLRAQLVNAEVCEIDEFGSLRLYVDQTNRLSSKDGPILSAIQRDTNSGDYGPFINYLLFIKDGYVTELQIYKDDGSQIISGINAAAIQDVLPAHSDNSGRV